MTDLFPYIIAVVFFLLAIFVILLSVKIQRHAQDVQLQIQSLKDEQSASVKQAVKRQQQNLKLVEQENIEQHRLIQHMETTILELKQGITTLDQQLQELQQRDPDVKLYQQAKQLIASGTSINEVVESCGIPRAEAEVLFSLSQHRAIPD